MSQMQDPNGFTPLDSINTVFPETDFLAKSNVLEDAMRKLGKGSINKNEYPDYFDDILTALIDLVPLE